MELPENDESNPPPEQVLVEMSSNHSPGSLGLEEKSIPVPLIIRLCNSPVPLVLQPISPDDCNEASTDEGNAPPLFSHGNNATSLNLPAAVAAADGCEIGRSNHPTQG